MIKKSTATTRTLLALAILAISACNDGGIAGTGDPTVIMPNETDGADSAVGAENPGGTNNTGETDNNNGNGGNDNPGGDGNTGGTGNPGGNDNSGGDSNPGGTDTSTGGPTTSGLAPGSNSGTLATATPQFQWNATDGADAYQLVLTEAEGNKITYNAATSACAGTNCTATPTAAFHNNNLTWQVDSLSGGQVINSSPVGSFTTPRSYDLTPETSNPSVCDIWPSISYDNIIVLNNIWNNGAVFSDQWSQKIAATELTDSGPVASWTYDWLGRTDGDPTAVKAYPQIIYGNKLGTHVSGSKEATGLPETVSALPEFKVDFAFTETLNGNVERNVALESFFHDSCNITGPCDTTDNRAYEMMIWVVNPEENRPGELVKTGEMIDDRLWDVYIKRGVDVGYIAFTAQTAFTEGSLNWNRFVDWTAQWTAENSQALNIQALNPNLCMAAIEMGTEMWWGNGSFSLNQFNVTKTQP